MVPGNPQDHEAMSRACQLLAKEEEDLLAVFLCGSRARGDHRKDSDYDIMMVLESDCFDTYTFGILCRECLEKQASIPQELLQISTESRKSYERERKKGNSFIYCALRDGKLLFSKGELNTSLPKKCVRGGKDRIGQVHSHIRHIELSLNFFEKNHKQFKPRPLELENLGFASMHLCWAVCMLNNFCPVSKYTVLKECRKYFTKEEFKSIKRAYSLYVNRFGEGMRKKTFMGLFKAMKSIVERIEGDYVSKSNTRKSSGKRAAKHMNSGAAN